MKRRDCASMTGEAIRITDYVHQDAATASFDRR